MPHPYRIATAFLFCCTVGISAFAQQIGFTIWKGNDLVGGITAIRQHKGENATYAVSSYSEVDVVMKQVVRSTMAMEYHEGRPIGCFTSMRLNGSLRDSTFMRSTAAGLACFVHPKSRFILASAHPWSTSRMYFEEPLGQTEVFVESVLRECPLHRIGEGRYQLELPGRKSNTYRYVDGKLQEVEVDRPLIKLVFKRA